MKKLLTMFTVFLSTLTVEAAPTVEDVLSAGAYHIYLRANLVQGNLENVGLSVSHKSSNGRIAKFFKGPGQLAKPELESVTGNLMLAFLNADGSTENASISAAEFGFDNCVDVSVGNYRVCTETNSGNLNGFGSNLTKLVVLNLDIRGPCGIGRTISLPRLASVSKKFETYYTPNTFADFNIDPIKSVGVIKNENGEFVEIVGQFGVYRGEPDINGSSTGEINPDVTTERLNTNTFKDLVFSDGSCPADNGPLGG